MENQILESRYDAVFISDLHLGNGFVDLSLLKNFLTDIKGRTARLFLVGDIFDLWRGCRPSEFADLFTGFEKIIYIRGNHDGINADSDNPFPDAAVDSELLKLGDRKGIVTHAHFFDANFDKDSLWARIADAAIYRVSRILNWDIKAHLGFIGQNYSDKIENSAATIGEMFGMNFMIIGHTHYGGSKLLKGIRLFNLGSWITRPYALFLRDNRYCFSPIKTGESLPDEKEFQAID